MSSPPDNSTTVVDRALPKRSQSDSGNEDRLLGTGAGQIIDGKYRLERLLGQGGMGVVYLSTHLGTGRLVAVKVILPALMRNPGLVERFKREARAAGRLRHPNIVDVTDFGVAEVESHKIAYLVMEYLEGFSLSEVLAQEKRLQLPWVVDILEQVCSAVKAAHDQATIHRDLKPANIWLEPNAQGGYRVKVLDFGIAKLAEETEQAPSVGQEDRCALDSSSTTSALTVVGAILGTPLYMSPEQCRGESLDARSDVYSLGVIAYQMISGVTPFIGDGSTVLRAHQEAQPPTLQRPGLKLPKPVSSLIGSALAKDPGARPQNALAFAQALRARSEGIGVVYRRAFALYSEYFPQIIKLSLLAHVPAFIVTIIWCGILAVYPQVKGIGPIPAEAFLWVFKSSASFIASSVVSGLVGLIVIQLAVTPLKPVTLRAPFATLVRGWRPFLRTGILANVRILLGTLLFVAPGIIMMVRYALWAPVVLLEGMQGKSALRRSWELGRRSPFAPAAAILLQIGLVEGSQWTLRRLTAFPEGALSGKILSELTALSSVLVLPLISIALALVYLKMRQLGGEPLLALPSAPAPHPSSTHRLADVEHQKTQSE